MRRMFQRRKDRGLLAQGASPDKLASQAEARIVNEVHNFAVLPMVFIALFDKRLNADKFHGASEYGRIMSLISSGYFMVDMTIVLKHFEEHGPEPLIHAVICVTFFMYSAITYHMQWFVPRTLLWEVSTPFVHLRWLLHALGKSKTTFYKVNGVTMMAVFFGARVVFGSKLVWNLWRDGFRYMRNPPARTDLVSKTSLRIFKCLSSVIQMLNIFWFYKMCRGAVKVFRPQRIEGSKGAKRGASKGEASRNAYKAASAELLPAAPGELVPPAHEEADAGPESSAQSDSTRDEGPFRPSGPARLDDTPGQEDLEVIDIPEEDV